MDNAEQQPDDLALRRDNRRRLHEMFGPGANVRLVYEDDPITADRGSVCRLGNVMVVCIDDPAFSSHETTFIFGLEHDHTIPKPAYISMEGFPELEDAYESQLVDKLTEYVKVPA